MFPLRAGQIKAARAMLDWSQDDLARAAGLSATTIRSLESGCISPRGSTNGMIRQAIETAGLEFIEPEGVRRRSDEVRILHGADGVEAFLDDVRHGGPEILCVMPSQALLETTFGMAARRGAERIAALAALTPIRCIVCEAVEPRFALASIEFRTLSRNDIGPVPYVVAGDRHALVLAEGREAPRLIVFRAPALTRSYRDHFLSLWPHAVPLRRRPIQAVCRRDRS